MTDNLYAYGSTDGLMMGKTPREPQGLKRALRATVDWDQSQRE